MIIGAIRYKVPPPVFDLILVTNARECVVMTSKDPDYIQHVRAAIEQAIIGTGQSALGRERAPTVAEVTPQYRGPAPSLSNQNSRVRKA